MSNKFEKLIEYVINDDDAKASDLFHEIVVGKSREIYEGLMQDDIGGDEVDDFIDDVSADEEGVDFADDADDADDAEETEVNFDDEVDAEENEEDHEELEDRVVDLEDKLDELMAEFDDLIGDEAPAEEVVAMDDELGAEEELSFEESVDADAELEEDDAKEELEEGAELTAAPKPTTSEEGSVNTKSANANDAGKKAKTDAKPVSASTTTEKGRPAPKAKDMGIDGPEGGADLSNAPAPKKGE